MLQEHHLIPFQTAELLAGPWLVFAPHPDDETFGMGGTLLLARRRGLEVTLVVLTDGALGGAGRGDVVANREAEAREAARRLGIREVQFWREPDRGLTVTEALIERVARLVREKAPASVFFTSPLEPHPDHRATAALVWEGLKRCDSFSGTAYAYEVSVQCPVNRLVDISAVADEKAAVMTVYASQLAENNYVDVVLALNRTRTYTLPAGVTHAEAFYAYEAVRGGLEEHIIASLSHHWRADAFEQVLSIAEYAKHRSMYQDLEERLEAQGAELRKAYRTTETLTLRLEARDASIQELHRSRQDLAAFLEVRSVQLDETKNELEQTKGQLAQARDRIEQLSAKITQIETSRSWRITRPLRAAAARLREVRRYLSR